jgi:ParB/RepB/Spo0J family partition protein
MSGDSSVQPQSVVTQFIPLAHLTESPTNPRKHFDLKKLEELSLNIKEVGVLEPLLVRPRQNGNGTTHEIVCGHRRSRAGKLAGLGEVPCIVRDFTDEQVRLIQLAENAARENLSPVEEADAYAALVEEGVSLGAIAQTLGKKPREIAKRLPLARLPKRVKDALAAGHIQVGHAELIGLIPDAKMQERALGRFLYDANDSGDGKAILGCVPLAMAKRIVEEEFMTALSLAVFDPEDAGLSPLGPCSACPHLAGNNLDLFGEVTGKAVCTNPKDFQAKTEGHLKKLRESGYTVLISKNELKKAFPYGDSDQVGKDFVDLGAICHEDPKRRTYEELLGKAEKLTIVYALKNGRVRKLYPAKAIRIALAAGHAFAKEKKPKAAPTMKETSKSLANLERIGDEAVSRELAAKLRAVKLAPSGWIDLVLRIAIVSEGWRVEGVIRRHGFEGSKEEFATKREKIIAERMEAMTDAEKRAFLVDFLAGDWVKTPDKAEQELYKHILKLAGVDYVKVANAAIDAHKRKAAEAKATEKPPIAAKTARAPKKATGKK